jgi:hypothetical protein
LFLGDNFLGQFGIRQRFTILLPIGHHPVQKALDRVTLRSILNLRGNQQPGEAGDGECVLPRCVRDGNPEIFAAAAAATETLVRLAFTARSRQRQRSHTR